MERIDARTRRRRRPDISGERAQYAVADATILGKHPRPAVDDLLKGRRGRSGPTSGAVDQHLDSAAVDNIQPNDVAAAIFADLQRSRIKHEHVFQENAQPSRKVVVAVGARPKLGKRVGPLLGAGFRVPLVARLDRPLEGLDLVFARLDACARRRPRNSKILLPAALAERSSCSGSMGPTPRLTRRASSSACRR
jgi:hypothetical protein